MRAPSVTRIIHQTYTTIQSNNSLLRHNLFKIMYLNEITSIIFLKNQAGFGTRHCLVIVVYDPVFRPSPADKVGNFRQVDSEICYIRDPITDTGGPCLQTLAHSRGHPIHPQNSWVPDWSTQGQLHPATCLPATWFARRHKHRYPAPLPSVSRNQSQSVTKCCFDDPRLTGLWNHGRGISADIGLADRIPMIQNSNGWPGNKSHPFKGMKRKRFCPNNLLH